MTGEHAPRLSTGTTVPAYTPRPPSPPVLHQQPSPLTQLSPSTVKASPQQTPGPFDAHHSAEPSTKRGMRSQIACARCRRSKTKCDNTGQGTVCKACANTNRECKWDHAAVAANSNETVRRGSSTADVDNPPRKRRKPLAPTVSAGPPSTHGLGTYEDALRSPLLTAQAWEELFEIYQKNFSIDFPFLHKRTFLSAVQQQPLTSSSDAKSSTPPQAPQPYAPLLLAFLTQTARFHDKFVQYGGDPIKTAEFYAEATRVQMGADIFGPPTLEKIQTLLLLGFYEWTALKGTEAWIKIGTAIRCAIVLGYPHLDLDEKGRPITVKESDSHLSEKDQWILREIERRTFWSCCLMDCYLSWGINRPTMLGPEHLKRTQLVCSDGAFTYGRKVRTRLLGEDDAAYAKRRADWSNESCDVKWEVGEFEAELTWYIKIVFVFGEVVRWSCEGGRRQVTKEGKVAPWNAATKFKEVEDSLERLKRELPEDLQLTPRNTDDRIYNGSGLYVSIHAMYTTCFIWLYREYMPVAPWTLTHPKGPTEAPLIEEAPPNSEYWIQQARTCFGACSEFTNLIHALASSRSQNNLVETPMVAFACYSVAICTIYCYYFPNMDPNRVLSSRLEPRAHDVAFEFLIRIEPRFTMTRQWVKVLANWQRYYRDQRKKYKNVGGQVSDSPPKSSTGDGGGLKDYVLLFEKEHKQFGDTTTDDDNNHWTDKDIDLADTRLPHDEDSAERTLPPVAAPVKRETEAKLDDRSGRPSSGVAFTAVNHNAPSRAAESHTPSNAQVPPVYTPASNNGHPYHANSTSQYRTHASPTNVVYQYSAPPHAQTNTPNQNHFPSTVSCQGETAYQQSWQQPPLESSMHAARMAIEVDGAQTFQNSVVYDPIMRAERYENYAFSGWPMGTDFTNYISDNPSYYPYQQ
ncbi:hypothetical protein BDW02DRAFT_519502 [Decorospora gaudefroyi]|uniref:Zn(2)-C6 fungal-type domain-containing protein n=1 Tax=Decorospora gaudefroyi TaxID=184978 RepID=A0A6A5KMV4_9PLEO|nr:hypothetical protein BDW02DRAFT_519502 [Decorospora gaudefroyi]